MEPLTPAPHQPQTPQRAVPTTEDLPPRSSSASVNQEADTQTPPPPLSDPVQVPPMVRALSLQPGDCRCHVTSGLSTPKRLSLSFDPRALVQAAGGPVTWQHGPRLGLVGARSR